MKTMRRAVLPGLLLAGFLGWCGSAAAQAAAAPASPALAVTPATAVDTVLPQKTAVAEATGTVGASGGPAEAVVFVGQATISGRVIRDLVFGAPPVLEIIVDLSGVRGKGVRTGKAYVVSSQVIVHRPLVAFETVEVSFPFTPDGKVLLSRSAMASFGIYYSAAKGMTTTPVRITTQART